jgi:serine-type D-Ala-D-Ala carboxypeptidase (penicillin-binding protein 5/6)
MPQTTAFRLLHVGHLLSILALALSLAGGHASAAPSFDTAAPSAILVDYGTGTVLLDKNADQPVPPASLTKLMTLEVLFHEIKDGRIKLEDTFTVSEHAWRTGGPSSGGSTMFLKPHAQVSVGDLIQGIAVQSGNDAAVVVAEGLAGSEAGFAAMMNRRAEAIGLRNSHFVNPHGLPSPDEHVTMRDMSVLAAHLIRTYPDQYATFKEEAFTYNKIRQANRNPVLDEVEGADGLKTGHTKESGYSLVASAERDGRRLILAMGGLKSAKERAGEARKLLEWGFRAFEQVTLFEAGQTVAEATVYGGAEDSVPLVGREAIKVLSPRGAGQQDLVRKLVYNGPIQAPVREGDRIGTLQIAREGAVVREVPLFAAKAVEEGSLFQRAWDAATELLARQIRAF